MWRLIVLGVLGLVVLGVGLWLVLLVAMRTKYRPVLTFIRRMNRKVTNPRVLKTAGEAGASAAVIHHVGRTTGNRYRTPIGVEHTAEGLVVALPYGTSPDWLKNVLAAGSAVVEADGRTHHVNDPQVVRTAEVEEHFTAKERRMNRLYGVDQFLVLKRVDAEVAGGVD